MVLYGTYTDFTSVFFSTFHSNRELSKGGHRMNQARQLQITTMQIRFPSFHHKERLSVEYAFYWDENKKLLCTWEDEKCDKPVYCAVTRRIVEIRKLTTTSGDDKTYFLKDSDHHQNILNILMREVESLSAKSVLYLYCREHQEERIKKNPNIARG